ncbi:MAG: hypothetical protein ACR2PF_15085 [Rhizobiaceae bacterium]
MLDTLISIFGASGGLIAALLLVLVMLIFGYLIYRMINQPNFGSSRRNKQARLAVTDAINFGNKHKLVLLRRDDIEHLILIGGPADIVVESNIRRNAAVRPREQQSKDAETPVSAKQSSQPETDKPAAPKPRLQPVANETHPKPTRPQFVPRQGTTEAPKPMDTAERRSAVAVATPHVRSVAVEPRPTNAEPAKAAPLPPVARPRSPAVVGGLVAAPIAAAGTSSGEKEQESPFKDEPAPKETHSDFESRPEAEPKTLAPRSDINILESAAAESTGSVTDDMDALLNELNAKR